MIRLANIYIEKYWLLILSSLSLFFAPLGPTFVFVGFLVISDFLTGVLKAYKKSDVKSRRMIDKFYTSVAYFIGIIITYKMEQYFGDQLPFLKAVVAIIAATELQSIRENIKEITGVDLLQPVLKFIKRKEKENANK